MQPRGAQSLGGSDGEVVTAVLEAIRSVRYGSVEVVIHDGRVVAIERREKVRINQDGGTLGRTSRREVDT